MTTLGIESETAIDVEEERRERQKKIYRVRLQSDARGTYKKMKNIINKYGIYRSYNYDKAIKSTVTLEDLRLPTQFVQELKNEN